MRKSVVSRVCRAGNGPRRCSFGAARHAHRHGGREEKVHLESSLAAWAGTLLTRTHGRAVDSGCGVVCGKSVTSMLRWGYSGARAGGRVLVPPCWSLGFENMCCSTVGDRDAGRVSLVKLVHHAETEPTSFQLNLRKDV